MLRGLRLLFHFTHVRQSIVYPSRTYVPKNKVMLLSKAIEKYRANLGIDYKHEDVFKCPICNKIFVELVYDNKDRD